MKTAEDKAIHFMHMNCAALANLNLRDSQELQFSIIKLLKEQDRDTRMACAEAVISLPYVCETPTGGDAISPDDAHAACMNVKAC